MLMDFWYVALRGADLASEPVARTICGRALVFLKTQRWRKSFGNRAVVAANRVLKH